MEKVYKTMRNAGVINIVIGSVIIISGACLLKRKSEITF